MKIEEIGRDVVCRIVGLDNVTSKEDRSVLECYSQKLISAYIKALKEAGFVVVPVEPTKNMVTAGSRAEGIKYPEYGATVDEIYKAMIISQDVCDD